MISLSVFRIYMMGIGIVLLFDSCRCRFYEDEFVNLPNHHDFVEGQHTIAFQNDNGNVSTLIVGDVLCGMGDPEKFNETECIRTSFEICGQGVARSMDEPFVLDFSHSKTAMQKEMFYFSDSYFDNAIESSFGMIDSMEVLSHMYYSVSKIQPIPINASSSIAEFYYVDQTGPIRYVLSNGEIWNRIP